MWPYPQRDSTVGTAVGLASILASATEASEVVRFAVEIDVSRAASLVTGPVAGASTYTFGWTAAVAEVAHAGCPGCRVRLQPGAVITASYGAYSGHPLEVGAHRRTLTFTVENASGGAVPAGDMTFSVGLKAYAYDGSAGQWGTDNRVDSEVSGQVRSITRL